jgi:hypothetical protein
MISLRRVAAACAVAMPLALGTTGIATADAYEAVDATAGPYGVSSDVLEAVGGYGYDGHHSSFVEIHSTAGPDGAGSEWTYATIGEDGEVTYVSGWDTAGPDGATSTFVEFADSHGW